MSKISSAEYVVAIGASAGGLSPLQELVDALPENLDNIAIVIAQHLSPEYKSMLAEIISRQTVLETVAITDGAELEPNHIYVTPPNCDAEISGTHLEIRPISEAGPRPSINKLFMSLAKSYKEKSVGIVLSGTGQDGSEGVIAIKKAGGLTICQDLESSRYSGMPQAAMTTGKIDVILSPHEIGSNLVSLIFEGRSNIQDEGEPEYEPSDDIQKLLSILENRLGTDFSNYKQSTIVRRLEKRLQDKGFASVEAYLSYIHDNDEELNEFFKYLLIGVTAFFRDEDAFNSLRKELIELISDKEKRGKFRVWVPGCATGEESVSIAIMLNEILVETGRYDVKIQVFATDINSQALKEARQGIYASSKLDHVSEKIKKKYFEKIGSGQLEVIQDIKQMILYTRHDLTSNPPFLRLDLISCRNLFIYFNQRLQNHIFPIFQYALHPGGILFLGKSETVGNYKNIFTSLDAKHRIFRRREREYMKPLRLPTTKPLVVDKKIPSGLNLKHESMSIHDMVKETVYSTFDEPYVVVDENMDLVEISGDTNQFLKIRPGLANMNLLRLMIDELQIEVRALVMQAIKSMKIMYGGVRRYSDDEKSHLVRVIVKPLLYSKPGHPYFIVIFQRYDLAEPFLTGEESDVSPDESQRNKWLEFELQSNKQYMNTLVEELETTNEELQALNEELQSSNEELQASNEELETANEELQATNEELENAYVDLREASQKLTRQKAVWEQLAFASPDLVAIIRGEHLGFEFINPVFKDMFAEREMDGKSIFNVLPEFVESGLTDKMIYVRDTSQSQEVKECVLNLKQETDKPKDHRTFNFTFAPLKSKEGSKPDVILYGVDITGPVENKRRAEENAKFFSTLAESLPEIVWTMDGERKVTYINDWFRQYFGLHKDAKPNDFKLKEHLHKDDRDEARAKWNESITEMKPLKIQCRIKDEKGAYQWHLVRCTPLKESGGEATVWVCTATDIHEQKTIEEKKDEFMSIASHELKTPLTTVKAYIEMLEETLGDNDLELSKVYANKATHGLTKMSTLVGDLLDMTRIQTGKLQIEESIIDFDSMVKHSIDDLSLLTPTHQVVFEGDKTSVQISGDRQRLEQVLNNLMDNAIKYSKGAEKIVVCTRKEQGLVVFEVQDFGPGVPERLRDRIFDRFYRVKEKKGFASGLGIGLYISRKIVNAHGGEIGVKSNGQQGSRFFIKLPIYDEEDTDLRR